MFLFINTSFCHKNWQKLVFMNKNILLWRNWTKFTLNKSYQTEWETYIYKNIKYMIIFTIDLF